MIKAIREILRDWNWRFDTTVEPNRFFYMLGVALPGIILTTTNWWIVGVLYIIILIGIRVAYLQGKI
jgi:hypothetical protein